MSSTRPETTPQTDLTAQARIRNAAITEFAENGFQKVNLRAIAQAAGVSAGLIIHHFGSKDGLRVACDEHVLGILTRRARTPADGSRDLFHEYLSDPEEYRVHVQYMARAIDEDAPAATEFVNTMLAESEATFRAGVVDGTMRVSSDPRALAVLNLVISLGILTMAPPLARALGRERLGPEVLGRLAVPTLELYTYGLYTDDTLLENARAAWGTAPSPQQERD